MEPNEITLPYIISVVVALAAVISPILTAIINNLHQSKLRKLDIKERNQRDIILHQRDIFEKYLQYAGRYLFCTNPTDLQNYGEYYHLALMLADTELREKMISVNNFLQSNRQDLAKPGLEDITLLVYDTMEKLSSKHKSKSRKRI